MAAPESELIKERYRALAPVGKGAFGFVYRGIDTATGQPVAIKRLPADSSKSEEWHREIEILRSMKHDNIVRYIDHTTTHSHLYIIMEFAEKGSLLSLIRRDGPLTEQDAGVYVVQILQGLYYLHNRGLVHRDIKAANVLIAQNGQVKLSDFGLTTPTPGADGKTAQSEDFEDPVGSVYWMAPEIVAAKAPTKASDVWSLGCVVIELLTGRPPFFDRSPANVMYHLMQRDIPIEPIPSTIDISTKLRSFLSQCFELDVAQRASVGGLLKHPWLVSTSSSTACDDGSAAATPIVHDVLRLGGENTVVPPPTGSLCDRIRARCVDFVSTQEWIRDGGLVEAVASLPKLQADEAFSVTAFLASTATQCASLSHADFFTIFASTGFWKLDMQVVGTLENTNSIFCACCDMQNVNTPVGQLAAEQSEVFSKLLNHSDETRTLAVSAFERLLLRCRNTPMEPRLRSRLLAAKSLEVLQEVVEQNLFSNLATYEWLDRCCHCILLLTENDNELFVQLFSTQFVIALGTARSKQCPCAVEMLIRIARLRPIYAIESIGAIHYVQAATDESYDYRLRVAAATSLAILLQQSESDQVRKGLVESETNVLLLGHLLATHPPPNERDALLPVFVEFYSCPSLAQKCSKYPKFLRTLVQKLSLAYTKMDSDPSDAVLVLTLLRQLYENSANPQTFVTDRELSTLLVSVMQHAAQKGIEDVRVPASQLFDAFVADLTIV